MKSIKKILFLSVFAISSFGSLAAIPEEFSEEFIFSADKIIGRRDSGIQNKKLVLKLIEMIEKTDDETSLILSVQLSLVFESLKTDHEIGIQAMEEGIIGCRENIKIAKTADHVRDYLTNIEYAEKIITQLKKEMEILNQLQRKYCPDLPLYD